MANDLSTTVSSTVKCCYNAVQCIQHDIAYITSVIVTEYPLEFLPTKDTPYLTLAGVPWGVLSEDFGEN